MAEAVLVVCGLIAVAIGSWRGYAAARSALLPIVREGDSTRTLVEASQPLHARARVRLAVRHIVAALAWLCVAMYGLYLLTAGMEGGL